jgi:hypothetical protein
MGGQFAHPEGCPSSAIAGVANGTTQVAAAERSVTRTYLMSSTSDKRTMSQAKAGLEFIADNEKN